MTSLLTKREAIKNLLKRDLPRHTRRVFQRKLAEIESKRAHKRSDKRD